MTERLFTLAFPFFGDGFLAGRFAVVRNFLMTTRRATSAGLGFNKIERQVPFTERYTRVDQFGIFAGMYHVTDFAPLAAVLPVDMQVVQVPVSVPEPGRIIGGRESEHVAIMAAETELEFIIVIRHIEIGRVWFDQEFHIRSPVRIMACGAFAFLDRPVQDSLVFLDEIFVAVETKVLADFRQELGRIARMGGMAG